MHLQSPLPVSRLSGLLMLSIMLSAPCALAEPIAAPKFKPLGPTCDRLPRTTHPLTSTASDPNWELPKTIVRSRYGRAQLGHTDIVSAVAFSPDGKFLVSGSRDKTRKIWNLGTKKLERTLSPSKAGIASLSFSPDGRFFADGTLNGTVSLWNWPQRKLIATAAKQINSFSLVFSQDGKLLASGGGGDRSIRLWQVAGGKLKELHKLQDQQWVSTVAFSPDSQWLASGGVGRTIEVWNVATGHHLCTVGTHESDVTALAFSPDGQTLASASADKTIRLWSLQSGVSPRILTGHQRRVNAIAFSPSGKVLLSGGQDQTVRLWRVQDGQLLRNPFQENQDRVVSVTFRKDGQAFATGSSDGTVQVFTYAP